MKTMKESGVPFGARMVFRLAHLPLIVMVFVVIISLPVLFVTGLLVGDMSAVLEPVEEMLEARLERLKARREELVRLWSEDRAGG